MTHGWAVGADFLDAAQWHGLRERLLHLDAVGQMRPAATGAGRDVRVRTAIRGDQLAWLERPYTTGEEQLLGRLEQLRCSLNQGLQLGLFDLECQYALYRTGARYARHSDIARAGAERVVSVVLYLNDGWQVGDGGELCLYTKAGPVHVQPRGGSIVLFLSAQFEHEVMISQRPRCSMAGWFRRRARVAAH